MKSLKLFAAFAVTLAALACNKEQVPLDQEIDTLEPQSEITDQNEKTDVPEGYVRLTFSTPTETKTSIDKASGVVSWTAGDQIKICWEGGSAVSDEVDIEEEVARFSVTVPESAEDLYAVYPSGITASVTDDVFSVDIPQSQTGRFADADIIVAKTTKTDLTYVFHHAVSLVRFVISEGNSRNITRAQFVDKANNSCLYGTLGITFSGSDIDEITEPTTEANDVIDITAVAEGDNWIAVPPTKSLTGYGLRMGTSSAWLPGVVGENGYTFQEAGSRLGFASPMDSKINDGYWYIKPEATGTGDGKSWANAGGPTMLQSLLGSTREYNGYKNLARGWRLDEKTILVAEGEYSSELNAGFTAGYDVSTWSNGVSFTIEGGYTESGIKDSSAKTIFGKSGEEEDENRAFFFYSGVCATIKDLYIQNHTRTGNGGGAAIYLAGSADFTANDCVFSQNKITSHNGAAIRNGSTGTMTITGCTFTSNIAVGTAANNNQGRGAAIYADVEGGEVKLSNCLFSGNIARNGGALGLNNSAIVYADKCKFIGNHNDGTAYYNSSSNGRTGSGTVAVWGSTSTAFFNSCEFRGNYAIVTTNGNKQAGNIAYSEGPLYFNNCLLFNNYNSSSTYKPIWSIYSGVVCIIVNSTSIEGEGGPSQGIHLSNASSLLHNSIFINGSGTALRLNTSISHDYNIISGWYSGAGSNNTHDVTASSLGSGYAYEYDTYAAGKAAGVTTGMSYYFWNGTSPEFTQTNKADVVSQISSTDFYTWLNSIDALDVDIRGVSRSSGYWPGSYQAN